MTPTYIHTHWQVAQSNPEPKPTKEYGCPIARGKLKTGRRKTRKPNKMYSECALELFSTIFIIRYFSAIGNCERTHHT